MVFVGLTGGIATGKSTVSAMFSRLGAYIIDADEVAKKVVEPGRPAWKKIKDFLGDHILKGDGTIDRTLLAEIVFSNESKRGRLEAIVHPEVFKEVERLRAEIAKKEEKAIIIFDAPLLIESGYHSKVERVILVYADEERQLLRLRGKPSRKDAMKRLRSQMPIEDKKRYADYIINNTRSLEETESQVRMVYEELKAMT